MKLETTDGKASVFETILNGKFISYLPIITFLWVSFKKISVIQISLMDVTDSVRMLYRTSLLIISWAFLKPKNNYC